MKKALLIVYSYFKKDNRVRKHKYFLKKAGYKVDIVGFEKPPESPNLFHKLLYLLILVLNKEKAVEYLYGNLDYDVKKKYDLIIANDWNTLPLAFKFKNENNILVYDSHEYALRLATESLKWRLLIYPLIKSIEKNYIKFADIVTTVSPHIVNAYERIYNISDVLLLRNIPLEVDKKEIKILKSETKPIKLYHHGHYLKLRKLDKIIEIIKDKEKFEFHLRLLGDIQNLKSKFKNFKNIIFHDPIDPSELVKDIKNYDLGIALQSPSSKNRIYSLPNKFFDFIFGGIPVVVCNDTISMAEVVRKYDIGFIARDFTSKSIKAILDKITLDKINQKKDNIINIKNELSSEKEWKRLVSKINKHED